MRNCYIVFWRRHVFRDYAMNIRSVLYTLAALIGDYRAIKNGRIGQRIARRLAGRVTGKMLGGLFRGWK